MSKTKPAAQLHPETVQTDGNALSKPFGKPDLAAVNPAPDSFQTVGTQLSKPFGKVPAEAGGAPVELSGALKAYLAQQGAPTDLTLRDPAHARQQAANARDMASVGQVLLGYWLSCIQVAEGSAGFKAAISDLRISKSTAYNAVQEFELFRRFDDLEVVRALATLGPNKALEFRNWDDSEIKALVSGETVHALTYEEAIELNVRELKERSREALNTKDRQIKQLKAKAENLATDLDAVTAEKQKLQHKLAHRFDKLDLPPWAAAAREEAMVLTEKAALCIESLYTMYEAELAAHRKGIDAEKFQQQATGTLFHALLPVLAKGHRLLQAIAATNPQVAEGIRFEFALLAGEVDTFTEARRQLIDEHRREATNREVARDRQSGRRGRPREFV